MKIHSQILEMSSPKNVVYYKKWKDNKIAVIFPRRYNKEIIRTCVAHFSMRKPRGRFNGVVYVCELQNCNALEKYINDINNPEESQLKKILEDTQDEIIIPQKSIEKHANKLDSQLDNIVQSQASEIVDDAPVEEIIFIVSDSNKKLSNNDTIEEPIEQSTEVHIDDSCIKSQSGVLEPEINNSSEEPEQESIVDGTETTASQIDCISTQLVGINEILGKAPWGNKKQKKLNELENELLYIKRGLRKIIKSLGKYNMATHENVEQVHLLHLSKIIKYAINLQGNIGNI